MREAREEARQYMHEFFARLAAHYATLVDDQGLEDPERALAAKVQRDLCRMALSQLETMA